MSDVAKWALLVAGIVALIALIVALPFAKYIDATEFGAALTSIVNVAGDFLTSARGLINNFLSSFGRGLLSGIIVWLFGKAVIPIVIKITAWVYHFIFK